MTNAGDKPLLPLIKRALAGEEVPELALKVPPSAATLIGFYAVSIDHGNAVFRMEVRPDRHANPMGTMHGGIICDIADAAMGMTCASLLQEGESFTTIELKTNFFRPVVAGQIEARARVINAGRTVVYLECDVVLLPEEKLVAKVTSTCMVLRGDRARGR